MVKLHNAAVPDIHFFFYHNKINLIGHIQHFSFISEASKLNALSKQFISISKALQGDLKRGYKREEAMMKIPDKRTVATIHNTITKVRNSRY